MNRSDNSEDDLLRRYIDPERIDKAPEGFTDKIMTRIRFETVPGSNVESLWKRVRIPVISAFITVVLGVIAIILPDTGSGRFPVFDYLKDVKLPDLKIHLDSYLGFSMPALMTYLLVALVLLILFDKALSGLFSKKEK